MSPDVPLGVYLASVVDLVRFPSRCVRHGMTDAVPVRRAGINAIFADVGWLAGEWVRDSATGRGEEGELRGGDPAHPVS